MKMQYHYLNIISNYSSYDVIFNLKFKIYLQVSSYLHRPFLVDEKIEVLDKVE